MLHQFEYVIVYFRVFADTAYVITDDRQIVFSRVYLFNPADPFYGTFLQTMTADGIHRIGRIDDKSAVIQDIDDSL